jgi:hypothetical protein
MKDLYQTGREERERQNAERQGREQRQLTEQTLPEQVGFSERGVKADEYGYAWLRGVWAPGEVEPVHSTSIGNSTRNILWHVFDPEGRYLGVCNMPDWVTSIMNGNVLALTADPDSGERVPVIYQIVPADKGISYP